MVLAPSSKARSLNPLKMKRNKKDQRGQSFCSHRKEQGVPVPPLSHPPPLDGTNQPTQALHVTPGCVCSSFFRRRRECDLLHVFFFLNYNDRSAFHRSSCRFSNFRRSLTKAPVGTPRRPHWILPWLGFLLAVFLLKIATTSCRAPCGHHAPRRTPLTALSHRSKSSRAKRTSYAVGSVGSYL